ncbi:MAG: DUF2164 family protein [Undibacterium sp.]
MSEVKRDWDVLSDDERRFALSEIVGYFEKEQNEKIGVVAAGQILDLILRMTNGPIYNRALDNVTAFLEKSLIDADALLRK